eukprot:TRINITY_DN8387_c0_g1_i1.p1 TRINITY_DN8387_c0_g1~~TRINITY_DN8387_c0_g1_i1.p1  ORF type:complete len:269 (+),score=67.77 TRINITY_DN8387_c0_g1_i1:137-943(+)
MKLLLVVLAILALSVHCFDIHQELENLGLTIDDVAALDNDPMSNIGTGHVIQMNSANFYELTEKHRDHWLILLYSPHCGYCYSLIPSFFFLAKELQGQVEVALIDGTKNSEFADKFRSRRVPVIVYYNPTAETQTLYFGTRQYEDILMFLQRETSLPVGEDVTFFPWLVSYPLRVVQDVFWIAMDQFDAEAEDFNVMISVIGICVTLFTIVGLVGFTVLFIVLENWDKYQLSKLKKKLLAEEAAKKEEDAKKEIEGKSEEVVDEKEDN